MIAAKILATSREISVNLMIFHAIWGKILPFVVGGAKAGNILCSKGKHIQKLFLP